jgi:hypothetical protein
MSLGISVLVAWLISKIFFDLPGVSMLCVEHTRHRLSKLIKCRYAVQNLNQMQRNLGGKNPKGFISCASNLLSEEKQKTILSLQKMRLGNAIVYNWCNERNRCTLV